MPTDDRPNILLIMTDQQRGDALSIENHPCLLTPNMDNIGHTGTRFTKAYTTCPSCVPARRSLMSGQHPDRTGMVGYKDGVEWEKPPPLLPQVLRDAGYQTALVGRNMHLYPERKRYGFENMIDAGQNGFYAEWLQERTHHREDGWWGTGVMHNDWTARPWHLDESLHQTNWTVSESLRWLDKRDPTAPFFLVVSFVAPHPPLIPPAFYMERYLRADLPEPVIGDWEEPLENFGIGDDVAPNRVHLAGERLKSARAAYYGLINHIDDQIRRILSPVRGIQSQTNNNTIVMFTADHGEMLGDHYHWRKQLPYEPAARIPMMIKAHPKFDLHHERVVDAPVCLEDIMPTCLDLAGVDVPETVDGKSLVPLMRGENPQWREHLHIQHAPTHQSLTDGKEKFIWYTADGREQFFDLTVDPEERHNMIDDAEAQPRITEWRDRLIAQLKDRPEGFSDGKQLIPGRSWGAEMAHARVSPDYQGN